MYYYGPYYTVVCLRRSLEYVHLVNTFSVVGLLAQSKCILGAHPKSWGHSHFLRSNISSYIKGQTDLTQGFVQCIHSKHTVG